jgi:hypothetical protein
MSKWELGNGLSLENRDEYMFEAYQGLEKPRLESDTGDVT